MSGIDKMKNKAEELGGKGKEAVGNPHGGRRTPRGCGVRRLWGRQVHKPPGD